MDDDARFAQRRVEIGQRLLHHRREAGRVGVVNVAGSRRRFEVMHLGRQGEGGRRRRIERREAARKRDAADALRDRTRAVEGDEAHLRLGLGEVAHHAGHAQRDARHVGFGRDLRVDRQQIVVAADVDAEAGEIDHHRGARRRGGDLGDEGLVLSGEIGGSEIVQLGDVEAGSR